MDPRLEKYLPVIFQVVTIVLITLFYIQGGVFYQMSLSEDDNFSDNEVSSRISISNPIDGTLGVENGNVIIQEGSTLDMFGISVRTLLTLLLFTAVILTLSASFLRINHRDNSSRLMAYLSISFFILVIIIPLSLKFGVPEAFGEGTSTKVVVDSNKSDLTKEFGIFNTDLSEKYYVSELGKRISLIAIAIITQLLSVLTTKDREWFEEEEDEKFPLRDQ